ncbi:hypothetical protein N480_21215 [Pseudoalteromonas luteoviolacea S2607]|uniref:hypothetical protein n=1 Tax=Pseudoalteromonas luteoviolacea TaxID=43657 RepID=UPI0007B091B6|nr:hypothetical protein [Pseudoalteromonas luteoviolacea]KZN34547.1 hypothetical protein N480_21215 [Pseudoalteromonas luteoviolacea S2607]
MIKIKVRKANWLLFHTRYKINDSAGLDYSIKKSLQIQLKRNKKTIFSGDVFKKTYYDNHEIEVSRISAPKSFKFKDGSEIYYNKTTQTRGKPITNIIYNGDFLAEVHYHNNHFKLSKYCVINIFSDDKEIIDRIMFTFMHDYNFNQIYFEI